MYIQLADYVAVHLGYMMADTLSFTAKVDMIWYLFRTYILQKSI